MAIIPKSWQSRFKHPIPLDSDFRRNDVLCNGLLVCDSLDCLPPNDSNYNPRHETITESHNFAVPNDLRMHRRQGYVTLRTNKGYGNIGTYLDQVRITITNPPTPTPEPVTPPSNLRYSAGTTWVNAVWDSTSGLTYRARISGGNWRSTTGSSMFFSGLQMGTPYTVYVYAQNSSGDKSDTVSINVETGCSFPGGHCLVACCEDLKNSGTPPVSPYAAIWMPTALLKQPNEDKHDDV